jgi:tetratricopeptide (TPR) repeat protein
MNSVTPRFMLEKKAVESLFVIFRPKSESSFALKFWRYLLFTVVICGCASTHEPHSAELASPPPEAASDVSVQAAQPARSAEVLREARGLLEIGSPDSLGKALTLIESRGLSQSEYGRMIYAIGALMIDRIYPDSGVIHGEVSPPAHLSFAKIIHDVQQGVWTPPPLDNTDYLTNVLPCMVLTTNSSEDINNAALPFLQKARRINPAGVLAVYFSALISERAGRLLDARRLYDEAVTLSNAGCYPAFLGIARILAHLQRHDDAITLLLEVSRLYPDNIAARRQLALSYIAAEEWEKADTAIAEVLSRNYRNPEFLLLQAQVFIQLSRYNQAQLPLDTYVSTGGRATNRQYLFLRARLAWEGNRSRSAATTQLRALLAVAPNDTEAQIYLARLLLHSSQATFKTEGRQILERLLKERSMKESPLNPEIVQLALDDAIERGAWMEANTYLGEILKETPTLPALRNAVIVKNGLGDRAAALDFARNAVAAYPDDENARIELIGMLTESDLRAERDEGALMINTILPTLKDAPLRSRVYYYRSRLRANEEDAVSDLRVSLLEDPRNVDALLGLIAIYDRRKDSRRVTFYLQQALVLAPDNPEVSRLRFLYGQ